MDIEKYTNYAITALAACGGFVAHLMGGFDGLIKALILAMAADYISGLIVAGVFKASPKTANGRLDSIIGWKGLAKKAMTIMLIMVANAADEVIGVHWIRAAVTVGFFCNEVLSLAENAGHMGLKIPAPLINAIEELAKKTEEAPDGEK